jgi:hypothetical protein
MCHLGGFQMYNFTGFLFYTIFSIVNYDEQHRVSAVSLFGLDMCCLSCQDHLTISVAPNDIGFGVFALAMVSRFSSPSSPLSSFTPYHRRSSLFINA